MKARPKADNNPYIMQNMDSIMSVRNPIDEMPPTANHKFTIKTKRKPDMSSGSMHRNVETIEYRDPKASIGYNPISMTTESMGSRSKSHTKSNRSSSIQQKSVENAKNQKLNPKIMSEIMK